VQNQQEKLRIVSRNVLGDRLLPIDFQGCEKFLAVIPETVAYLLFNNNHIQCVSFLEEFCLTDFCQATTQLLLGLGIINKGDKTAITQDEIMRVLVPRYPPLTRFNSVNKLLQILVDKRHALHFITNEQT
jgi:hypothetical protein